MPCDLTGRSRKYTQTRRDAGSRCRFFCICASPLAFSRARPKKVIVVERVSSGERCGRLSSDLHVLSLVPRNNTPRRETFAAGRILGRRPVEFGETTDPTIHLALVVLPFTSNFYVNIKINVAFASIIFTAAMRCKEYLKLTNETSKNRAFKQS